MSKIPIRSDVFSTDKEAYTHDSEIEASDDNKTMSQILSNDEYLRQMIISKITVSEAEPKDWKEGEEWHKVLRTRQAPDTTGLYAQILETIPYDPKRLYSLETNGVKETIINLEDGEFTLKEI